VITWTRRTRSPGRIQSFLFFYPQEDARFHFKKQARPATREADPNALLCTSIRVAQGTRPLHFVLEGARALAVRPSRSPKSKSSPKIAQEPASPGAAAASLETSSGGARLTTADHVPRLPPAAASSPAPSTGAFRPSRLVLRPPLFRFVGLGACRNRNVWLLIYTTAVELLGRLLSDAERCYCRACRTGG
jgi:hypothetical protein